LEAAGFEIVAFIEKDHDCCQTLEINGRKNVLEDDGTIFDFSTLESLGPIALLAGGPPCQPFSKSGLWTQTGVRGISDPRTATISSFLQAVGKLKPKVFLIENVEGFAHWGGLELLKSEIATLSDDGLVYSLHSEILNAADFGVPQKRKRLFVVGVQSGIKFEFPSATHGVSREPYATAWDACAGAAVELKGEPLGLKGRWAKLLPSIPPGKNYLWHTNRSDGRPIFGWRTRYWSFLYKLDPKLPSPTIVANPSQNSGPFHWENRLLTTAELAAVQTFPKAYKFAGERASRHRQIGNAVPPLLAEHVGRALMKALGGAVPLTLSHTVARAKSQPKIPKLQPVPTEYHSSIGEHADHPGTGLGPKPRKQPMPPEATSP
jgi:DNA (cytosine-5)-methyltransferase 1